jgi:hypothetical protein
MLGVGFPGWGTIIFTGAAMVALVAVVVYLIRPLE